MAVLPFVWALCSWESVWNFEKRIEIVKKSVKRFYSKIYICLKCVLKAYYDVSHNNLQGISFRWQDGTDIMDSRWLFLLLRQKSVKTDNKNDITFRTITSIWQTESLLLFLYLRLFLTSAKFLAVVSAWLFFKCIAVPTATVILFVYFYENLWSFIKNRLWPGLR